MWIDGTKYYFKLGDKSAIILGLKKFLNRLDYIKTKNTKNYILDATFQTSLVEYQTHWKLKQQDGSLNAENYAHFGLKMTDAEVEQISLRDPILRKLLYGVGVVPERIKIEKGVPFLINNNDTPVYPIYGKTDIRSANGNAVDNAVDEKLAILLGDKKQKPIVRGANQTGTSIGLEHYVLKSGLVYVIHIYGSTGNEFIDIYSPADFGKPVLSPNAHPKDVGYFGLVCTNQKTGAVLRFAHLDSIQSQAELEKAWNTKMTNSVGSRYIGTIGTSGGRAGNMHAHITYFINQKAMDEVRAKKIGLNEEHAPKYYVDFRALVNPK
jgi:hypothetical protein